MSGENQTHGVLPTELAGHPKQNAAPIPSVRVGVTKNRNVLVGDHVPSIHPADEDQQAGHGI